MISFNQYTDVHIPNETTTREPRYNNKNNKSEEELMTNILKTDTNLTN